MAPSVGSVEGIVYWLILILCGLLGGAGISLALSPPFEGARWLALGLGMVGLAGMALSLYKMARSGRDEESQRDRPDRPGHLSDHGVRLEVEQAAGLLLACMEGILDMLRVVSDRRDLDRVEEIVVRLQEQAAAVAVESHGDRLSGGDSRRILEMPRRIADLYRELVRKAGRDPSEAGSTLTLEEVRFNLDDFSERLQSCSTRVRRLVGQFQDKPGLHAGMSAAAQSLKVFLKARGGRYVSSADEELALAPTVRVPDLPTIERILEELKELEQATQEGLEVEPDRIEGVKRKLLGLVEATRPLRSADQGELAEVNEKLQAAGLALESGEVSQAVQRVSDVIRVVRAD